MSLLFKEIRINSEYYDSIYVLRKLAKVIPMLLESGKLQDFHYFFEPDIWIRLQGDEETINSVFLLFPNSTLHDYIWEGEEQWSIFWDEVKQIFQSISLLGLKLASNPNNRPSILKYAKLAHCMANALGYKIRDERNLRREMIKRAKQRIRGKEDLLVKRGLLEI